MSFESEKIQWALLVSASIGWLVCLAKGLMVLEYEFTVSDINFKITDVGGQREQRTIWIEFLAVCLQSFSQLYRVKIVQTSFVIMQPQQRVTCVIFLAAIDEYDTYLITEDNERANRLQESIEIFRQIQLQNWLQHTTFILFLNKKDVFEEKIRNHHLIEHFSDFPGHNLGLLIIMDIIYSGSG